MNAYRAQAGLAPLTFSFSSAAQQCSVKNAQQWQGHCGGWENWAGGYTSQDGQAAASDWYSEGPPPAGQYNHYSNLMDPSARYGYYGWAYDPASGSYDVTLDFA